MDNNHFQFYLSFDFFLKSRESLKDLGWFHLSCNYQPQVLWPVELLVVVHYLELEVAEVG